MCHFVSQFLVLVTSVFVCVLNSSDSLQIVSMLLLCLLVVFMGSRKYQNDNDFDTYVTEHGGSSNAFTECEQVNAE